MKNKKIKFFMSVGLMFLNMGISASAFADDKKTLTPEQRSIIPIGAFLSTGDLKNLKTALNEGLNSGLTINEIKEILIHSYAYAGFPRSLNGINTFIEVVDERKSQGIKDEVGKEAGPFPENWNEPGFRDKYGENVRKSMTGTSNTAPYTIFAPPIEQFLKEHLFADLFVRDNLKPQERELTTISILAGLGNVNAQLKAHMNITMNLGFTKEQMNDFINVLDKKVNHETAENAQKVLQEVIKSR